LARILIVGGGCRGLQLAGECIDGGHAVRMTTRSPARRGAIEAKGAECWLGTPDRLATLRGALDGVTIACWLLAGASAEPQRLRALHTDRLQFFLTQAIDTTIRGFVYEAPGTAPESARVREGERIARSIAQRNAIPIEVLDAELDDREAWMADARAALERLLAGR
jgi:hypothetical protein